MLRPGTTFYDVGSNVGFFALLAHRLGSRVTASEPMPEDLSTLRKNVEINATQGIRVVAAAASDRTGEGRLEPTDSMTGHVDASGSLRIASIRFDDYVARGPKLRQTS